MKKKKVAIIVSMILCVAMLSACTGRAANGKTAYDLAVEGGYKGTQAQWLESLRGQPGQRGTRWSYGATNPTSGSLTDAITGDMYLNTNDGTIWAYNGTSWNSIYKMGNQNPNNTDSPNPKPDNTTPEKLISDLSKGGTVKLNADLTVDMTQIIRVPNGTTSTLDLDGHTLAFTDGETLGGIRVDGNLTVTNGKIDFGVTYTDQNQSENSNGNITPTLINPREKQFDGSNNNGMDDNNNNSNIGIGNDLNNGIGMNDAQRTVNRSYSNSSTPIVVNDGATLTLKNVKYNNLTSSGILAKENSTLNISDSQISAQVYCVSTNASTTGYGTPKSINITATTLTASNEQGDATALLVNVPTNVILRNCMVKGDRQATIFRGCTAMVENCTFVSTGKFMTDETSGNNYFDREWKSGNEVPYATMVIGNRGTKYQYPTKVTLIKATFYNTSSTNNANGTGNESAGNMVGTPNTQTNNDSKNSSLRTLYVYGNTDKSNGVTLIMDEFTKEQVGSNYIYGGSVTESAYNANNNANA